MHAVACASNEACCCYVHGVRPKGTGSWRKKPAESPKLTSSTWRRGDEGHLARDEQNYVEYRTVTHTLIKLLEDCT
jgi:hypothetical protein